MRNGFQSYVRITTIALLAVCLYGAQVSLVSAEIVCRSAPALAIADGDGDGVVTLGEIDAINAAAGGNAELQAVRDQLAAQGISGIQYAGCDAGVGDTGNDDPGTGDTVDGSATGANGTNGTDSAPGEDGESVNGQTVIVNADGTVTINGTPVVESTPLATKLPAVGMGGTNVETRPDASQPMNGLILASVGALMVGGVVVLKAGRRH